MAFNFDAFLRNFGQVAQQSLQTYETKQSEGKSLHQADYIAMAVPAVFAILSAFNTPATDDKTTS